jgi:hypothetical protein
MGRSWLQYRSPSLAAGLNSPTRGRRASRPGRQRFTIRLVADPIVVPSLFTAVTCIVCASAIPVVVIIARKRWLEKQSWRAINAAARPRRPAVSWQAGRWDADPRHAYVANVGDDTAYEVSVTACERVVGTAQRVPPYRADALSSTSELPCYINFCVDQRLNRPISLAAEEAPQTAQNKTVCPDRTEVVVRVDWRSDGGEWFNQTVRTD